MRPYIICHMAASVDGKTDGKALSALTGRGEYETLGKKLQGDAWICGRVTMQAFADDEPFVSATNKPAGPQPVHVARRTGPYAVAVDTLGKLRWPDGTLDGDHLIAVVSERVPEDYLAWLREKGVSYVVAGSPAVDLARAVDLLAEHFGIRRLLLEGGGHVNAGFLAAGLVNEVSVLVVPGIDGRHDVPALFDGIGASKHAAVPLRLMSVERREKDALWLRYEVAR